MQALTDRNPTMSSREIAELTGKLHKNVMADIRSMCDQLGIDSAEFSAQYRDGSGRILACFELDRYHTEVLVTGYDVKRRAAVIRRWYDLESGNAQPAATALPDFNNPVEAARAWADAKEAEQRAVEQAEAAKPAVEFVGRFVETGNTKSIRETAKILGLPEKAFIKAMIEDKILFRQSGSLLPHQKHHAAERFVVKTGERNGHAYEQTRVTSAGIDYLARVYGYWIGEVAA
ncbi:phage regulatory protein/antirepressor Ant [Halomonas sp. I1]|uniref:phage regulatory protein/antirepressor Ant n=1 Tax=Halomonas sp. I1 TaxID=393536 RepID=UPI0028E079A7|nr:phage regulatory protein/antirepressor Ant [Halomonas sp. I1]MDT8894213.1 phage regulatory protein/antirepressor Ant [Halomonas sp. I1]